MRQLHIVRLADDDLAMEVARRQVADGDEVRVVLTGAALDSELPTGSLGIRMPSLQYDEVVSLMSWSDRVVRW